MLVTSRDFPVHYPEAEEVLTATVPTRCCGVGLSLRVYCIWGSYVAVVRRHTPHQDASPSLATNISICLMFEHGAERLKMGLP
jgi:hypothetical protein